jgi:hypothetical protein
MKIPDEIVGQATLALDELITRTDIPPEARAELREWVEQQQPGLLDQSEAAAAAVDRGMRGAAAAMGHERLKMLPATQHPDWVRLGALNVLAVWAAGKARTCMHAPSPERPQPIVAAAWRPGVIACADCRHLFRLREGSEVAKTCDGCGRVTQGPPDDPIRTDILAVGELMFMFGVCRDCCYGMEMANDADTINEDWNREIIARILAGESVSIDEVAAATEADFGPTPTTPEEAIAELERLTGLDIETINRITGREIKP